MVRDSVLMHGCRVASGAVVDRAILDKGVVVGTGAVVGDGEPAPNDTLPHSLSCGATVIGKGTRVPAGIAVGRNCLVPAGPRRSTAGRRGCRREARWAHEIRARHPRHAARRRRRQPAQHPRLAARQAGGAVRRRLPHHRLHALQRHALRARAGRPADAVQAVLADGPRARRRAVGPLRPRARHQDPAAAHRRARLRLVQGHRRRDLPEPLVHGGPPPGEGADPLGRPRLPHGLRGDDRRPRARRRGAHDRRDAGAVGGDAPLRHHGHRRAGADHQVPGEGAQRRLEPRLDGYLRVRLRGARRGAARGGRDQAGVRLRQGHHPGDGGPAQAAVLPVRGVLARRRHAVVVPRRQHGLPRPRLGARPRELEHLHRPGREGARRPPAGPLRAARRGEQRADRTRLHDRGQRHRERDLPRRSRRPRRLHPALGGDAGLRPRRGVLGRGDDPRQARRRSAPAPSSATATPRSPTASTRRTSTPASR